MGWPHAEAAVGIIMRAKSQTRRDKVKCDYEVSSLQWW